MISFLSSILLLCAFTSAGNMHDSFYPNVVHMSMSQQVQSVACLDVDYDTYIFQTEFNMSCYLWYDNEGSYRIDTFNFEVETFLYNVSSVDGTYVYYNECDLVYSPTWSFTQNSYGSEFENTYFNLHINDDGEYNLYAHHFNSVVAEGTSCPTFFYEYDLKIDFITDQFFKQVESYIGSPTGGVSDMEYQRGYSDGWHDAENQNSTAVTIFSGILNIGLLPVNFFLSILNFEVFGIDIGGFVTGLLSIAIVVIIVRFIFGSK